MEAPSVNATIFKPSFYKIIMLSDIFLFHENSRTDPWKYPQDRTSALIEKGAFAVADGITRTVLAEKGLYPSEFQGGAVAEIFVNRFTELSKDFTASEGGMNDLLHEVNKSVYEFNVSIGFDYDNLKSNYWLGECVGGGCIIRDRILYYGILEDTYLNVLRGQKLEDQVKMKTQIMESYRYGRELANSTGREFEEIWAVELRNNPEAKDDAGNRVGWGSFNGQKEASEFWQVGSIQLQDDDIILLVTDGALGLFGNEPELSTAQEIVYRTGQNTGTKPQVNLSAEISNLIKSGKTSLESEKTIFRAKWSSTKA